MSAEGKGRGGASALTLAVRGAADDEGDALRKSREIVSSRRTLASPPISLVMAQGSMIVGVAVAKDRVRR